MQKLFFVCVFTILYFARALSIVADTVATPCTYKTISENGKFVFVMIAPDEKVECLSQGEEAKIEAQKIRKQFSISGLYNNDGSTKPLWTVDWYSYKIYLSSDGQYLVRTGPWASTGNDEAFGFYDQGKLLKPHKVNDLINNVSLLPHTSSHFTWEKETRLNNKENILEVATLEDGQFRFDIKSGEILSQQKPIVPTSEIPNKNLNYIFPPIIIFLGIGIGAIVLIALMILVFLPGKKIFSKK